MPLSRRNNAADLPVLSIGIPLNFNRKILIVSFLVLLLAMILEIWASNRLSTFGEKIAQLNSAKDEINLENQLLENQIAQQSSLNRISNYSKYLGLQDIKNIRYLEQTGLAYNQ